MRLTILFALLLAVSLATAAVMIPVRPAAPGSRYAEIEAAEADPPATEKATFAMGCYYLGEERLGSLDGVHLTRSGILDGEEVVEVAYDPAKLPFELLLAQARRLECTNRIYAHTDEQFRAAQHTAPELAQAGQPLPNVLRLAEPARDAIPRDRLFSLRTSNIQYLPLTPMQATKINAELGLQRGDGTAWLSPHQLELLDLVNATLRANPHALDGLSRPDSRAALHAYEKQLLERLLPSATPSAE